MAFQSPSDSVGRVEKAARCLKSSSGRPAPSKKKTKVPSREKREDVSQLEGWDASLSGALPSPPSDAADADQKLRNLVTWLGHELKTPLTGVLNPLTLLSEQVQSLSEDSARWVKSALVNAERLQRTLTLLLDVASVQSEGGQGEGALAPTYLSGRDLQRLLRMHARSLGIPYLEEEGSALPRQGWASACYHLDSVRFGRVLDSWLRVLTCQEIRWHSNRDCLEFTVNPSFFSSELGQRWKLALETVQSGSVLPGGVFGGILTQTADVLLQREDRAVSDEELLWGASLMKLMGLRASIHSSPDSGFSLLSLEFPRVRGSDAIRQYQASGTGYDSALHLEVCVSQAETTSATPHALTDALCALDSDRGFRIRVGDFFIPADERSGLAVFPGLGALAETEGFATLLEEFRERTGLEFQHRFPTDA